MRRAFPVLVLILGSLLPAPVAMAARNLYVGGVFGPGVAELPIGADGTLGTAMPAAPASAPTNGVALTPDGAHLYATSAGTQQVLAYDVGPTGALTPRTGITFAEGGIDPDPDGIAISPDGSHAYVADPGPEGVRVLAIGADGGLTQSEVAPMPGADFTTGVAITPDGRQLFASASNSGRVYGFDVAADGSLKPQTPAFVATVAGVEALTLRPNGFTLYAVGTGAGGIDGFALEEGTLLRLKGSPFVTGTAREGIVVSPRDGNLYAAQEGTGGAEAFAIGELGELTPIGVPVAAAGETHGIAMTPDGAHLYSAGPLSEGSVSSFVVSSGLLALTSPTPTPAKVGLPIFDSLAVSPDQPPLASFTATQQGQSNQVSFDASGSSDPDGKIVRYDWTFGDGQALADGGPTPSHTYPGPGTYTAAVTLTDDEGCSTTFVSTGQTASCNGSAVARAERQVVIPRTDPPPGGGTDKPVSKPGKGKPGKGKKTGKPKATRNAAPVLRLSVAKRQRLARGVSVRVTCNEACLATVRAKLRLRTPGSVRTLKVRRVSRSLAAGQPTKLKLKLSRRARAAAAAVLANPRGIARLALTATATDSGGKRSAPVRRGIRLLP